MVGFSIQYTLYSWFTVGEGLQQNYLSSESCGQTENVVEL